MSLTYSVSIPQLVPLQQAFINAPERTKQELTVATNRSLLAYQATAKDLAPIDQGILKGSIQLSAAQWSGNTITGSVGTNNEYSLFQEQGTGIYGPHHAPIVPKSKPTLVWYSNGAWHFAKSVKGSKPRWYMKGSLEQNQSNTERNYQAALDAVANSFAGAAA